MVRIIGERWSDLVCCWRTVDVFGAVMIAPPDRPRAFGGLGAEGLKKQILSSQTPGPISPTSLLGPIAAVYSDSRCTVVGHLSPGWSAAL
jgi:hypothetical protein